MATVTGTNNTAASQTAGTDSTQARAWMDKTLSDARKLASNFNASDNQILDFMQKAIGSEHYSANFGSMLQQVFQKRTEASQWLTNMLKALFDAARAVVQNIGR